MKKYLYTSIALLIISLNGFAQTIPNGSFENWTTTTLYEEAPPFTTTNSFTYLFGGQPGVTKSTDKHGGNYAAKLIVSSDIGASLLIGTFGPGGFVHGQPYTSKPDSLVGYVKYSVATDDSIHLIVGFKKANTVVGFAEISFTGIQPNYTRFSLPITFFGQAPDSFAFILQSSVNDPPSIGNLLYIDDLAFVGTGVTAFPNGGFETWDAVTTEDPDGWFSSNFFTETISVVKSMDAHSGGYAAHIKTTAAVFGGDPTGFLIYGSLGSDGPSGGLPVTTVPKTLSGYYKYAPVGIDTGVAVVSFHKWNTGTMETDSVGEFKYKFMPAANYTPFTLSFTVNGTPDSVLVGFGSSDVTLDTSVAAAIGSILKIDDVSFGFSTGLNVPLEEYFKVNALYPNPVTGTVSLEYYLLEPKEIEIKLYDAAGRMVKAVSAGNSAKGVHTFNMDVSNLATGAYYYSFNAGGKETVKKFTIAR